MEKEKRLRDLSNYLGNIGIQFLATLGLDGRAKNSLPLFMWMITNITSN